MTTSEHATVWEAIPAYALGSLEPADSAAIPGHLETCASCRAELDAYQRVTDALALAAPPVTPSPSLRERLLAEVRPALNGRAMTGRKATHPRKSAPRPLSVRRGWPAMALVGLAAVILGGLLWAAVLRPGLAVVTPEAGLATIDLLPTDLAPDARGELRFAADGATLEVFRLPALAAGTQYQLWLVSDGARETGALFDVNDNGWAETPVRLSRAAADYDTFGITIEPAGGSERPTGDGVLRGGW